MKAWIGRGLAVGALLAAVETVVTVVSSVNLSPSYLLASALFDLAAGVLGGIVACALARLLHAGRDDSFAGVFVPLGAATSFIYLADKCVTTAAFRGWPVALGLGVASLTAVVAGAIALPLFRHLCRGQQSPASVIGSSFAVIVFLVLSRHVTRSVFFTYLSPGAIATNGLLLVLLLLILSLVCRRVSRSGPTVGGYPWVSVRIFVVAALTASGILWKASALRDFEPSVASGSETAASRPNVVLISVDTLRADRLSTYGYERLTSPHLTRLASEGVLFRNAVSPGNWTGPGHASLLTGTLPRTHGLLEVDRPTLDSTNLTLAEILSSVGYRTAAIVANHASLSASLGFNQGFAFFDDRRAQSQGYQPLLNGALQFFPLLLAWATDPSRIGGEVNRAVFRWLERNGDAPFFLFVNYMDPHEPYGAPPPDSWRFPGGRLVFFPDPRWDIFRGDRDLTSDESAHLRALYDGEIAYVDRCIGELLDELRRRRYYDRTMVIVTSDHGEFFGEHRLLGHGVGFYQPVHHVPMVIKHPFGRPRGLADGWVSLVDVLPTILDAVGLSIPSGIQGQVLPRVTHPVLIEGGSPEPSIWRYYRRRFEGPYRAMYEGPWKVVARGERPTALFNLANDPGETVDVADRHADLLARIKARLDVYWASLPRPSSPAAEADSEALRRLKAAGYVQ